MDLWAGVADSDSPATLGVLVCYKPFALDLDDEGQEGRVDTQIRYGLILWVGGKDVWLVQETRDKDGTQAWLHGGGGLQIFSRGHELQTRCLH